MREFFTGRRDRAPASSAGKVTTRLVAPPGPLSATVRFHDWDELDEQGQPTVGTVRLTWDEFAPRMWDAKRHIWAKDIATFGFWYRASNTTDGRRRRVFVPPQCILSISWEEDDIAIPDEP